MNAFRTNTTVQIVSLNNLFKNKNKNKLESNGSSLRKLISGFIKELNKDTNKLIPSVIDDLVINFIPCLLVSKPKKTYTNRNLLESDEKQIFGSIKITNSCFLSCNRFDRKRMKGGKLIIKCLGDCIIDKDCGIDVSGKGYENGSGLKKSGGSYNCGPIKYTSTNNDGGGGPGKSAGYGTKGGGTNGGATYGDKYLSILHLGSGGGCDRANHSGGRGAGAIYLETANLINNGFITANGGSGSCCGSGSGGSIHIITNKLIMNDKAAKIEAIGGYSSDSKAGVGRIRIETKQNISNTMMKQITPKPYVG